MNDPKWSKGSLFGGFAKRFGCFLWGHRETLIKFLLWIIRVIFENRTGK